MDLYACIPNLCQIFNALNFQMILENFSDSSDLIFPVPELLSHYSYSNIPWDTEKISIHLKVYKIKLLKQGSGLSGIATTILYKDSLKKISCF